MCTSEHGWIEAAAMLLWGSLLLMDDD